MAAADDDLPLCIAGSQRRGHAGAVTWDRTKPWTAPAHHVDLYQSGEEWKFGVRNDYGFLHGAVPGVTVDDGPEAAKTGFLRLLAESTGLQHTAHWSERPNGSWHADLVAP